MASSHRSGRAEVRLRLFRRQRLIGRDHRRVAANELVAEEESGAERRRNGLRVIAAVHRQTEDVARGRALALQADAGAVDALAASHDSRAVDEHEEVFDLVTVLELRDAVRQRTTESQASFEL